MESRKEIIRKLNHSLDMACIKKYMVAEAIGLALGTLVGWARLRDLDYDGQIFGLFFLWMLAVIVLPTGCILGYRTWKIYRSAEEYIFCRVKLAAPHEKPFTRGMHYFTVVIDDPEEGTVVANTNAIFASWGKSSPLLLEYLNQTVTVGYNRETGMVVVIG